MTGKTSKSITITTESLQAIVAKAVADALANQGITVPAPKATPKAAPKAKAAAPKAEATTVETPKARTTSEQREQRKVFNRQAAAWMREKGLVPSGQAWTAVTADAVRNVATLRKLNAADGLGVKAKAAEPTPAADEAPVTEPAADKAPAKKAAARKTTTRKTTTARKTTTSRTRKAAASKATETVAETAVEEVTEVPEGAQVTFTEDALALMGELQAKGLSDAEIAAAMAAAGIA